MSCKPMCGCEKHKFLGNGKPMPASTVVRDVNPDPNGVHVRFTNGQEKVVPITALPANLNFINVLNASGTKTVATFATNHEDKTND